MSAAAPTFQQAHCLNHPRREAAARCTSCGQPFCRECVTELDGRMVCGACHRAKLEVKEKPKRDCFLVSVPLQLALGVGLLWVTSWFLGKVLLSTPTEFHEGVMWQRFGF
jgi:hypothetical protein